MIMSVSHDYIAVTQSFFPRFVIFPRFVKPILDSYLAGKNEGAAPRAA
jgi:hypothetical protein